ncbi:MAG: peptidase [Calditrichaeota bacterium]|nr:peptidase [Calditrichota bacterium]
MPGSTDRKRICVVFVDGIGVGEPNEDINPLANGADALLRVFSDSPVPFRLPLAGLGKGIDACLGVPGLPQSATGQTALFTGVNASAFLGYHKSGFPNERLRELLWRGSLLKRARQQGLKVAFVNAYRPIFFELPLEKKLRFLSVTTIACLSAGLSCFPLEAVREEKAIYHEFTNRELRQKGFDLPLWTPEKAGQVLASLSAKYDLCLYEFFRTDHAGHSADLDYALQVLDDLSAFLRSFLERRDPNTTLVVDHGNIEDLGRVTHTRNPALLAAWGWAADSVLGAVNSLVDFTPVILEVLSSENG